MRIGSIVRLSRPWETGQKYKGGIGIIEYVEEPSTEPGSSCRVRIGDPDNKCIHYTFTCFKHRFDVLKE